MCTIIMISIIQGLYILREDEADDEYRERRRRRAVRQRNTQPQTYQRAERQPQIFQQAERQPQERRPLDWQGVEYEQATRPLYDMHELRADLYLTPEEQERDMKDEWIRRQRMEEQQRKNEEERRRAAQKGVPNDLEQRISEETEKSIHW